MTRRYLVARAAGFHFLIDTALIARVAAAEGADFTNGIDLSRALGGAAASRIIVLSADFRQTGDPQHPDTVGPNTLQRVLAGVEDARRLGLPLLTRVSSGGSVGAANEQPVGTTYQEMGVLERLENEPAGVPLQARQLRGLADRELSAGLFEKNPSQLCDAVADLGNGAHQAFLLPGALLASGVPADRPAD